MADKRISQLVDRGTVANNDVVAIVVNGAVTTNKATISSIQTFMQGNLDLGVTSVGITLGSSGTDVSVTGSPITTSGNITINIPTASASNRGVLSAANFITFNAKQNAITLTTTGTSGAATLVNSTLNIPNYAQDLSGFVTLGTAQTITAQKTITTNGSSDTFIVNHTSGSGIGVNITKGGNGEGLIVNKTGGSGNAATITGTLQATTIVRTGGTSSQFLKADGSTDSNVFYLASNPSAFITLTSLSQGTGISYNSTTGVIASTITQYTDALARAALSFVAGSGAYNSSTGVITIPTNNNQIANGAGYIIGNQTITLSGDATGSGTTAISVVLANSGVTAGTYNNVATQVRPFTVDAKGRVTSIGAAVTITPAFSDVTGTPTTLGGYGITDAFTQTQVNNLLAAKQNNITLTTTGTSGAATLVGATINIPQYADQFVGTVTSVSGTGTVSGLTLSGTVTSSGNLTLGGTLSLTSNNVTTALGFTPYNATNPSGFTSNVGTVTSVAATAGTGISISGSPITSSGTINITNTAPDQVVSLTASTGISVSGSYPNFTITNTSPSSGGTVTNVTASAPLASSGGATPNLSITQASTSANGFLSSTDFNTFNNKAPSVAGGYLPLSGGTLTGALNGTSAVFTLNQNAVSTISLNNSDNTNTSSRARFLITSGTVSADFTCISTIGADIGTNTNHDFNLKTNGNTRLALNASTGAATFSSSVTATSATFSGILNVNSGAGATTTNFTNNGDFLCNYIGNSTVQLFSIRNNSTNGVFLNTQNSVPLRLGVSTATGGGTTVNHLEIASTGAATFSSSVKGKVFLPNYAASTLANQNSGIVWTNGTIGGTFGFVVQDGVYYQGDNNNTNNTFGVRAATSDGSIGTPVFVVKGSGAVGIGTAAPGRLLTISATTPVFQLVNPTTGTTADDGLLIYQNGLDSVFENQEAGNLRFLTSATERMRITSAGNVGIGTAAPNIGGRAGAGTLTVRNNSVFGEIEIAGSSSSQGGVISFYGDTTKYAEMTGEFESSTNGTMIFRTRRSGTITQAMRIFSDGNVGINTGSTNNGARLQVNGAIRTSNLSTGASSTSTPFRIGGVNNESDKSFAGNVLYVEISGTVYRLMIAE